MKKPVIRILGTAIIIAAIGMGIVAGYHRETQLELNSGMIREVKRSFGIPIHASVPKHTPLSKGHVDELSKAEWFVVEERGFPHPWEPRIHFCYPKLVFWIGAIERSFPNRISSDTVVKLTLDELNAERDVCATTKHLGRLWDHLCDMPDEEAESLTNEQAAMAWAFAKPKTDAPPER